MKEENKKQRWMEQVRKQMEQARKCEIFKLENASHFVQHFVSEQKVKCFGTFFAVLL